MSYGTIKVDTITFTDNSVDKSVSLSGLIQNPTFTGNITVTGTISGDVIRGGTTVSGATVTGTTANFVSGVFTTQISGATVTGTTASFTSGVFTNISGTTATITSGIIASGTAAAPSLAILADLDTGLFSPGANELAVATNGTRRLLIDSAGALTLDTGDATIYGVRVGRGGGAVATNTAVGASALSSNITGAFNTAIGNNALRVNTANVNTAVGDSALYSCTTGYQNVAIGPFALYSDVSGINNIAIGRDALYFNTATGNIAIGTGALKATTSGANNLGIGDQALFSNTEGTLNTVIGGRNTAYDNTTGSNNVVLGDLALRFNTIGSNNTCIGTNAGYDLTTGSNNTIIGNVQGTAGLANTVIIGAGATERLRIDSSGNVGIGTSSPSQKLTTTGNIKLAGAQAGNIANLLFTRTDRSWGIFNETDLRFKYGAGDTDSPSSTLLTLTAGNVGIGTSSPGEPLNVLGGGSTTSTVNFTGGAAGNDNATIASDYSLHFQIDANNNIGGRTYVWRYGGKGYNDGTPLMKLDASGRLGIGTESPDAELDVNGRIYLAEGNELAWHNGAGAQAARIYGSSTDELRFDIGSTATRALTIDSSGRLLVGTSTNIGSENIQIGTAHGTLGLYKFANNDDGGELTLANSRNGTVGSQTIVNNNDFLGRIFFRGSDGSAFLRGADIVCQVDGTPGANDMPGRLVFATTADGASSPTERLRITSAGLVGIGTTPNSDSRLHVQSGANDSNPVLRLEAATGNFLNFRQTGSVYDIHVTAGDPLSFTIGASERARIDSSGRLLVGTSSARSGFQISTGFGNVTPVHQFEFNSQTYNGLSITHNSGANSYPAALAFGKSRGSSAGSYTAVANGDNLGWLDFYGADGTNMVRAANILAAVDGTPGANDMPGRLVFSTTADGASSPSERMRINSNGIVVARNSVGDTLNLYNAVSAGTSNAFIYGAHSSASAYTGTTSFVVWTNGNVVNTNNSYGSISDIKLKENIVDANSQWDDLKALQVRNYNFKEGQTHTQIGLVAQEAELVSPGLVSESPDRDDEGNDLGTVTKSVNYSVLYMKAVKALQEAMERIEQLEANNADLLARVSALESA
jgi:hypothetical protein